VSWNWHSDQVAFLEDLASAAGFWDVLCLPDGVLPDVARIDLGRKILFIGDAKDTETPGCSATARRLTRYVSWLAVHSTHAGNTSILVLCYRRASDTGGWARMVATVANSTEARVGHATVTQFGPGLNVLRWSVCPYRAHERRRNVDDLPHRSR
jgi:hypothetical protein